MQPRYSPLHQAIHWATALCIFAILPLAWVMTNTKAGAFHDLLYNWHKTLGLIVLLLTAWRIVWRFVRPPPPYPPGVAVWDRTLAHLVYVLFFAVLLWMPVTGYVMSSYGGHPPRLFDVLPTPQLLSTERGPARLFGKLHLYGQWAVYALILLHIGAVAIHLIRGRDGVLGRMLPAYAAEPRPERQSRAPRAV